MSYGQRELILVSINKYVQGGWNVNLFLEVNNYCELKCRFCVADNTNAYPARSMSVSLVKEVIERNKHEKLKCAFITGGEPLIHPNIFEILSLLRLDNYYIYITTNGLQLKEPEFLVKLLSIGINRLAIPIYGSTALTHDAMTGVTGSYEELISALDNLFYVKDKYSLQTKIELRLLMSNFTNKENVKIVEFIAERYSSVDYINLNGLQLSSRTTNYEDMIETSLHESRKYLQETVRRISEYGIKGTVTGIPICILGEEFKQFYCQRRNSLRLFPHISVGPYMVSVEETNYRSKTSKEKGEVCKRCKYYCECEGLQRRYIDRYGFSDLVPIE